MEPTVLSDTDTQEPSVCVLTLNRPDKLNAFNHQMADELAKAVAIANKDNQVRVIVITGAGRSFCAGADFREGFISLSSHAKVKDDITLDIGGVLNLQLFECDTPIIAAINGAAVGIGATMLIPMDMRIASNQARFAFPFTRRGIVCDGASSWFLPRLVGFSKAQEWLLRGHLFSAEDALAAGFVNHLAEPENLLAETLEIARDIAVNCAPESVSLNKQLLRESLLGHGALQEAPMRAHMMESQMLNRRFTEPDCAEGVSAFLQKRSPQFQNRGD